MAHKKTTKPAVARKASKALRSKKTSALTKSLAGSALSQSPGKHRGKRISKDLDIASPKSAGQIRKDVGVTKRDRRIARKAAGR